MPKFVIDNDLDLEVPVRVFLEKVGTGISLRVQKGTDDSWNLLFISADGQLTSGGSLPKHYGLKTDALGYPVVKRYCDK